jgi:hypothetical protein
VLKNPDGPNRICIVLVVVVLSAIAETLIPRVKIIVLRRRPALNIAKTSPSLQLDILVYQVKFILARKKPVVQSSKEINTAINAIIRFILLSPFVMLTGYNVPLLRGGVKETAVGYHSSQKQKCMPKLMWWGVPVVKRSPPRGLFDHRWAPK